LHNKTSGSVDDFWTSYFFQPAPPPQHILDCFPPTLCLRECRQLLDNLHCNTVNNFWTTSTTTPSGLFDFIFFHPAHPGASTTSGQPPLQHLLDCFILIFSPCTSEASMTSRQPPLQHFLDCFDYFFYPVPPGCKWQLKKKSPHTSSNDAFLEATPPCIDFFSCQLQVDCFLKNSSTSYSFVLCCP